MNKKFKKKLSRVMIGAAVYAAALLLPLAWRGQEALPAGVSLTCFLAAYFIIGGDVVAKAVRNIGRGQVFDENFLMTIATAGAFFVGDYPEAAAVMLFYQIGELFQSYAVNKSRRSIADLMDIRPDVAAVLQDGEVVEMAPEKVNVGDIILVRPGEKIPLDGVIIEGNTTLDTKALTGESVPREALLGEAVISGCINLTGAVQIKAAKPFGESTVSKILDLVENAGNKKAQAEQFISKFARYYTPIVVFCALLLAMLPPLFTGEWSMWIYRALTFLVISCPCALVISIPLSFFGGVGGAGKCGILVKGSSYLEALAQTQTVVMDKTGTLTKGVFSVCDIVPMTKNDTCVISEEELLEMAAYAESFSNHPISQSLRKAYSDRTGKDIDRARIAEAEETAGYGVSVLLDGKRVYAGSAKLMARLGADCPKASDIGTVVYVADMQGCLGHIVIADELKEDATEAVAAMRRAGVKRIVMLTGDRKEAAEHTAAQLGIREVHAQLLPGDKLEKVEELFTDMQGSGKLVFVGDGMNDAPVLARADIGVAMGGLGSDAAIEAADVVIMTDEPLKIAKAMQISVRTLGIVKQNIVFAIGVKVFVLLLAAVGMANMWAAVFADVGVTAIAVLNAMRALSVKK